MTFCSNSNELELPRVGEIWRLELTHSVHIMLLVVGPRVYAPAHAPQVAQLTFLDLESGELRRVNAGSVNPKRGWQMVRSKKAFANLSTCGKVFTCPK